MTDKDLFDLLAELISAANSFDLCFDPDVLTEKDEEKLIKKVDDFFAPIQYVFEEIDSNPDFSKVACDIINWCEKENDYYIYRTVICRLDTLIDIDEVVKMYDVNATSISYIRKDRCCTFVSLNTNYVETGILILPKVKSLKAYKCEPETSDNCEPRQNAHSWSNNINDKLKNIYAVENKALKGYLPQNVIYSIPESKKECETIRIGVSPILNKPIKSIFELLFDIEEKDGHQTRFFEIKKLLCEQEINRRFELIYDLACEKDCDIFISPEMFGTEKLTTTAPSGYNEFYMPKSKNDFKTPTLTLAPTQWNNQSNILKIFSENGYMIGSQYKHYGFVCKSNGFEWKEHLKKEDKNILIIHIPGWGRLAFPICKDYLVKEYRNIMTSELKANFLLCPSFSFGEYNFDLSCVSEIESEVRTVWINSCSALMEKKQTIECVGIASTPIVSSSPIQKLVPKCDSNCDNGCLFTLDIPKNPYLQTKSVDIEHYIL